MPRRFIALILFMIWPFAAAAEPPACSGRNLLDDAERRDPKLHAEIMAEAATTPNAEAIFWKIEGRNGAAHSWLYGTAHLTDPRLTALAPGAETAIANSTVVALELKEIVDRQVLARAAMKGVRFMAMPLGQSMWDLVDDTDEAAIKASPHFPTERFTVFQAYQPWVVAAELASPACEKARELAGLETVDGKIGRLALAARAELVGLETVEEQLGLFAAMPLETQVKFLVATAKAGNLLQDYTETLVQLYLSRRIAALMPLWRRTDATGGADTELLAFVENDLIFKRNLLMRDRARPLLEKGGVFIAVGTLHLPGRDGLVELLRQAGYTVTPVN